MYFGFYHERARAVYGSGIQEDAAGIICKETNHAKMASFKR